MYADIFGWNDTLDTETVKIRTYFPSSVLLLSCHVSLPPSFSPFSYTSTTADDQAAPAGIAVPTQCLPPRTWSSVFRSRMQQVRPVHACERLVLGADSLYVCPSLLRRRP